MDRIELRGLRVVGTHGVLPEENERAQPFELDIDVMADLSAAGHSDELSDTLDYGTLVSLAAKVVADEHHQLLERLAERVTEVLLGDGRVAAVRVTVRKSRPPVAQHLESSGVTIERSR